MKAKAIVFIIFAAFMIYAAIKVHPFGELQESRMDDYIIMNAQNETAANNVVTSVVFDYRGYDTLGEATVLFSAIAGALITLRKEGKNE
ncbi:MAG: hypothetical protein FE036_01630 [Thermoplasmata archaeon]|nr:MAG: hypothetical protein FE036_01630 [Thermoplasmata archaeon]